MGSTVRSRDLPWERTGLVLAVGLLLLQVFPAMWTRSLWQDEAYTVAAIQDLPRMFSLIPGQMPVYYAGMQLWGRAGLAPWWLRLPSLLTSVGALLLIRAVARRIGGTRCAAIVPVLLAASPMFVAKAVEARPYAMVELLVISCWYCFLRGQFDDPVSADRSETGGRWMWLLAVLATIGPGFHALFFIYVMPIGIAAMLARPPKPMVLRVLPALIGCMSSSLVLVVISSGVQIGAFTPVPIFEGLTEGFFSGLPHLAVVLWVLVLVGAVHSVSRYRQNRRVTCLIPLLWFVVPLVLALVVRSVRTLYNPRYLVGMAPAVAILIGICIVWIVDSMSRMSAKRGGARWSSTAGMSMTLLLVVIAVGGPRPSSEWIENWDEAARYVAGHAHHGDCLAFAYRPSNVHQAFRAPFEAAWNRIERTPVLELVSPARPFGKVSHWEALPNDAQLAASLSTCDGLWVVSYRDSLSHDFRLSSLLDSSFDRTSARHFQREIVVGHYRSR